VWSAATTAAWSLFGTVKVFASLGQMQNVSLFGAPTSQLGLVPEDTQQGISLLDEDRQGD